MSVGVLGLVEEASRTDITGSEFLPLLVASTILKQAVIVNTGKVWSSLVRQSNGSVLISEGWNERPAETLKTDLDL